MTTLLLVEDNEENWDMLSRRLRRRGYEVVIATDGQQGVEQAKSIKPDLILMDISLPVLNGWEATQQILSLPQLKSVPIIALTAHAMASDREKALSVGCVDYHTKPVELDRLITQIQAALTNASNA